MQVEVDASGSAPWSRLQILTTDTGEVVTAPSGYRIVVVATESSAEVRDLASLRRDLELARVYAMEFGKPDQVEFTNSRDTRLALWSAALVSYGRAFNSGVRSTRLDIDGLTNVESNAHQFYLDLRNKHVAHAVNDFEQTIVIAYLTHSAFAPRRITRIGQTHVELLTAAAGDPEMLIQLCDQFIKRINRRLKSLHVKIGGELAQMGIDAVYALPDLTVPDPDRATVAKRRR